MPAGPRSPSIVLLHGFTQNAHCWGPFGEALRHTRDVHALDLPGHGDAPLVADWPAAVTAIAENPGAKGSDGYLGYSMGGRLALHLALARPSEVGFLILIGTHPGIEDDAERATRRAVDQSRADRLEAIGMEAFLDDWLAQPLFAGLTPATALVSRRLDNDAARVADALRVLSSGGQEPLWDRLPDLDMPVLYIAGSADTAYVEVGRRAVATIGANAELAVMADCGHAAHLEAPEATAARIEDWIARVGGATR